MTTASSMVVVSTILITTGIGSSSSPVLLLLLLLFASLRDIHSNSIQVFAVRHLKREILQRATATTIVTTTCR
jgi:hypothetical protein